MADRHIYYIGRFVHDGAFADAAISGDTPLVKPKLREPLALDALETIAASLCPDENRRASWGILFDHGLLVADAIGNDSLARAFLRQVVRQFACDIADGTLRIVAPSEVDLVEITKSE